MTEALIKIKQLSHLSYLPKQATEGAAGFDVAYPGTQDVMIMPTKAVLIKLGFAVEVPPGFEIQVRPRSGLALKEFITVANSPGTIDSDYRGECGVILHNFGNQPYTVRPGERVAQFVVAAVPKVSLELVEELSNTERGTGGFGSTGKQ